MRHLLRKNAEFWTHDRSLTALFIYIMFNTFVVLPFTQSKSGEFFHSIIYSMILVSGVFAISATHHAKIGIVVLAGASFILHWTSIFLSVQGVEIADDISSMIFLLALTWFVLLQVFKEGDISLHRIQGAVAIYVIIGLIFSKAYHLIFLIDSKAFLFDPPQLVGESFYSSFVYFSYVTLTTLGYGDITAVVLGAKSLVMVEGLIGQLFPAIMITRLVSLEIESRKKRS